MACMDIILRDELNRISQMKKYNSRFLLLISALILVACQRHFYLKKNSTETIDVAVEKAAETMQQFRKTSPLLLDSKRLAFLNQIQYYSDSLDNTIFIEYLKSAEEEALKMENSIPIYLQGGF